MPSSRAEHSIPSLATPRIFTGLMEKSPGSLAPGSAQGTLRPVATFGAPHTIWRSLPSPASTWHTRSLSASGWGSTLRTSATTTPAKGGATDAASSTSRPAMVSSSAIRAESQSGEQNARSQFSGNLISCSPASASELLEEAQVVLVEHPQVADAVAQHGQALDAGPEGETDVALGIQADVAHDVRMHLPRPADFQPAARERPVGEAHVDLGRRLREREVRRPESHVDVVALEELRQEVGVDALQVGKADVVVHPQPLDLVEHRRMRRVGVDPVGLAWRDDPDRRLVGARVADLHGAGVRAQQQARLGTRDRLQVEGVV